MWSCRSGLILASSGLFLILGAIGCSNSSGANGAGGSGGLVSSSGGATSGGVPAKGGGGTGGLAGPAGTGGSGMSGTGTTGGAVNPSGASGAGSSAGGIGAGGTVSSSGAPNTGGIGSSGGIGAGGTSSSSGGISTGATGGTSTGGIVGGGGAAVGGSGPEPFTFGVPPAAAARFKKGINLGNRLEAPNEGDWGGVVQAEDFPFIAKRGFDHVRIPIRFSGHALAAAPYTIDAAFFGRIDTVLIKRPPRTSPSSWTCTPTTSSPRTPRRIASASWRSGRRSQRATRVARTRSRSSSSTNLTGSSIRPGTTSCSRRSRRSAPPTRGACWSSTSVFWADPTKLVGAHAAQRREHSHLDLNSVLVARELCSFVEAGHCFRVPAQFLQCHPLAGALPWRA